MSQGDYSPPADLTRENTVAKPGIAEFADAFASGMVKLRKAFDTGEGVTLESQEVKALVDAMRALSVTPQAATPSGGEKVSVDKLADPAEFYAEMKRLAEESRYSNEFIGSVMRHRILNGVSDAR